VAQGADVGGTGRSVHAIQPTAAEHGRIAGLNMAGVDAVYKGSLLMNVIECFGLVACSFGSGVGGSSNDATELVDHTRYRYVRFEFQEDRLVGAVSVGRTDHVGVLRTLISKPISLGEWKPMLMRDPHRLMEAFVARTVF
jgi:NAD(P)H-nitrite reductase large subunit